MKLYATWFKTGETVEGTLPELAAEFARRGWRVSPFTSADYRWTRAVDANGRQRGWVQAGEWASY